MPNANDLTQAENLGAALRLLQDIAQLTQLPLTVSQSLGPRALATMMRVAHQPQNATRLREREGNLADLLSQIDVEWLARSPALPVGLQGAAWIGYYHAR